MSIEQPKYTVLTSSANREVRRYEARIVAETTVEGTREKALNEAFSILAGYIFGGNMPAARIAMTAPVLQQKTKVGEAAGWVVQFTMPTQYCIDDLPRPNDERVRIREVPASTMAVVRFSGLARTKALETKEKELREFMAGEKLDAVGEAVYAFYNPPFTLPPLRRNEVLIEVAPRG
jgi:hypothetical protein